MITFGQVRAANTIREREMEKEFWHSHTWSVAEWTNALAGEAGEACNIAKKIIRMYPAYCFPLTTEQKSTDLHEALAKELADVVLYADLIANKLGIDLGATVVAKFNEVSERIGSTVRLEP